MDLSAVVLQPLDLDGEASAPPAAGGIGGDEEHPQDGDGGAHRSLLRPCAATAAPDRGRPRGRGARPSCRCRRRSRPGCPPAATTRWQGTRMATGLRALAWPTARAPRAAEAPGQFTVGDGLSPGDALERLPDDALVLGAVQVEGRQERRVAGEVVGQRLEPGLQVVAGLLADGRAHPVAPAEADAADPVVGGLHREGPDRRLEAGEGGHRGGV